MSARESPWNVLFLCTGNSARSIIGEAIVNHANDARFRAFSAGSRPTGKVNVHALELLQRLGYDTADLRSKSWDEFAGPDAVTMDFVFTVCDSAASESCPAWPGHPMTVHWGIPDPAAVTGSDAEIRLAFAETHRTLRTRTRQFMDLPIGSLDAASLRCKLAAIGRTPD